MNKATAFGLWPFFDPDDILERQKVTKGILSEDWFEVVVILDREKEAMKAGINDAINK